MKRVVLALISLSAQAALAVELDLVVAQPTQLIREPNGFTLTLVNNGRESIAIAPALGLLEVSMRADSRTWARCRPKGSITRSATDPKWVRLEPGALLPLPWTAGYCSPAGTPEWSVTAGTYQFRATWTHVLASHTPRPSSLRGARILDGALSSSIVQVVVRSATGIDFDALEWMNQGGSAIRFPRSRYAAHALTSTGRGFAEADPASVLRLIDEGIYDRSSKVPDETSDNPKLRSIEGEDLLSWRSTWFELVLNTHPDLWFANELRLRLALDKLAMKDVDGASSDLQALAEKGSGIVRGKAGEYLSLMIERGMIGRDALEVELGADSPPGPAEK